MVAAPRPLSHEEWAHAAARAEAAILQRHVDRVWGLPGTALGRVAWPADVAARLHVRWHYWWQAHLLDTLVDAQRRDPSRRRLEVMRTIVRGARVRNLQPVTANNYFDDKAWLALAVQRIGELGPEHAAGDDFALARLQRTADSLSDRLLSDMLGGMRTHQGVLPWRRRGSFYNAPTNGPASILCARAWLLDESHQLLRWIQATLTNSEGLVSDGVNLDRTPPEIETPVYSYCQGATLGAAVEWAWRASQRYPAAGTAAVAGAVDYAGALITAIRSQLSNAEGVVSPTYGGGDGGLFNGITVRYLAVAAVRLREMLADPRLSWEPDRRERVVIASNEAAQMVFASAGAVWAGRREIDGHPLFAADWAGRATIPTSGGSVGVSVAGAVGSSAIPERDLSVQLSGWMALEAAAMLSGLSSNLAA